ncbi:MAG: hypothetical protein MJA82_08045 [Clostridia bacterium]|nr:hypothetical protein [Clostridia bacterium]
MLTAASIAGIISKRFRQTAVLGHILAGLETDVNELKASGRSSSIIALKVC